MRDAKIDTYAREVFYGFSGLKTLNGVEATWDTSEVKYMNDFFSGCTGLKNYELNLSGWDTSNVVSFSEMFRGCRWETLNLISFEINGNAEFMFTGSSMKNILLAPDTFKNCTSCLHTFSSSAIEHVPEYFTLGKSKTMGYLFKNASKLIDIPKLDTSNITDMDSVFDGCTSLTTIPELDTSKATDMSYMFKDCRSLPEEFPWVIDCSSISDSKKIQDMFYNSSVKRVKFKNLRVGTSYLKRNSSNLEIIYV